MGLVVPSTRSRNRFDTQREGAAIVRDPLTLAEAADEWRSALAQRLRPLTVAEYVSSVRQLGVWCAAHGRPTAINEVTVRDLRGFMNHLLATRSPATARARHSALKSFFGWTTNEGITTTDPTYRLRRPTAHQSVVPVYTERNVEQLIAVCAGNDFFDLRDAAIIRFFATTGARRAEVAGLCVTDLDFRAHSALLHGRSGRERVAHLTETTVVALRRYLHARARHRWAELDALWLGRSGQLGPHALAHMVEHRGTIAGVEGAHAHRFRDTFAHEWLARGGSDQELLSVGGWREPRVLVRYRRSVDAQRARTEHERLDLGDYA
jgi:site-specific recombinase XerD